MRTISNNTLSIPTFSVEDIKDDNIAVEDKAIIENLVKNMVLVENGIYLKDIYDIKSFDGKTIQKANPKAIEVDSFYISKYPISQKEWTQIMGYDPSEYEVSDENLPVFKVKYEDCQRFIAKLNRITGLKFDLPTPAQWDYAAHGGRTNNFHFENKTLAEIENYAWVKMKTPFPIGLKDPNTIGLYDMFGNIGELCKREGCKDIVKGGNVDTTRIYTGDIINGYNIYNYHDFWSEEYTIRNIGFRLVCNDVDIKSLL
jgi:formylglycine-generating enzyme required for sulfatase activity